MVQEKNQTEKFVECVHLHRNMLWLTEKLKNLYSPIVFFQFFFSCLQICAITLELILVYHFLISYFFSISFNLMRFQHEHITIDRFVQVLPVYPTILAMLFIYCYFGNELSVQVIQLNQQVKFDGFFFWKNFSLFKFRQMMFRQQFIIPNGTTIHWTFKCWHPP